MKILYFKQTQSTRSTLCQATTTGLHGNGEFSVYKVFGIPDDVSDNTVLNRFNHTVILNDFDNPATYCLNYTELGKIVRKGTYVK